MKRGAAKSAPSTTIRTAVNVSRNEFTKVYALGPEVSIRRAFSKVRGPFGPAHPHVYHSNVKILPGLRILIGSSAFFMATITKTLSRMVP